MSFRRHARVRRLLFLALAAFWLLPQGVGLAQQPLPPPSSSPPPGSPPPAASDRPLRLFIDCANTSCDMQFFRTEIALVDHVRDRQDADVHVLVTSQANGGGGRQYSFAFIGLGRFSGVNQTLLCNTTATDTEDERRRAMLGTLKLGLVRYIAETPAARDLQVGFRSTQAGAKPATTAARDPWNYWVFNTHLQGRTNGESSQNSVNLQAGASANRVTEAWKILSSASGTYNESNYTFSEGDTYKSVSRGLYGSALVVKSLGAHWGGGGVAQVSSSTYSNWKVKARVAPAIEYNIYPYSESTRHQLTFNYAIGLSHSRYRETTIYGKDSDTLGDHSLTVSLEMQERWGTTSTSFQFSQYLNDPGKNRLVFYGDLEVRLFKGFSFNTWGNVSRIRDLVNLPMGEATQEEVLVRQRQLATSYSYNVSMGFSYRFGSMFNNVVNARFANVAQTLR